MKKGDPKDGLYLEDKDYVKDISAAARYGAPPLLVGMLDRGDLDAILILDPFITRLMETGKYRSVGTIGKIWNEVTGQNPMLEIGRATRLNSSHMSESRMPSSA